jgi:hypothetical protein
MEVDGARNINGVTSKPNVFETLNVDGIRGGNARVEEATYRKKRTRCIIILLTTIIVVVASIAVAVGVGLGVVLGRKTKGTFLLEFKVDKKMHDKIKSSIHLSY